MTEIQIFYTHPIEIVWLAISVFVLALSVWSLREAVVDSAFMMANNINGARKVIADVSIRQEATRVGIALIMTLAATSSMFFPPPPPNYLMMPQSLIAMLAWNAVAVLMVVGSLLERTARRKLQDYAPVSVNREIGTLEPGGNLSGRAQDMRTDSQAAEDRGGHGSDGSEGL